MFLVLIWATNILIRFYIYNYCVATRILEFLLPPTIQKLHLYKFLKKTKESVIFCDHSEIVLFLRFLKSFPSDWINNSELIFKCLNITDNVFVIVWVDGYVCVFTWIRILYFNVYFNVNFSLSVALLSW